MERTVGVVVADSIDMTLLRGEALGIIGPNGAGKTTLFGIITGTVAPDAGRVMFEGSGYAPHGTVQRDGGGLIDGALRVERSHGRGQHLAEHAVILRRPAPRSSSRAQLPPGDPR